MNSDQSTAEGLFPKQPPERKTQPELQYFVTTELDIATAETSVLERCVTAILRFPQDDKILREKLLVIQYELGQRHLRNTLKTSTNSLRISAIGLCVSAIGMMCSTYFQWETHRERLHERLQPLSRIESLIPQPFRVEAEIKRFPEIVLPTPRKDEPAPQPPSYTPSNTPSSTKPSP